MEEALDQSGKRQQQVAVVMIDLDHSKKSTICMSIGASLFPEHGKMVDLLLNHADKAMYQVKREGKNNYRLLSAESRS